MSTVPTESELVVSLDSAGILLTPEEFDSIEKYDEEYRYELIQGVLVVNPIPLPEETGPNELLGYYLLAYQMHHPQGKCLSDTLPQQYVRLSRSRSRRLADRLIWVGLGRLPDVRRDVAAIAVEFVSAGRRNRQRDYEEKRAEYIDAGILEYWIFDRFRRTLTVVRRTDNGVEDLVVQEHETYETPLLPGFVVPLARILQAADR